MRATRFLRPFAWMVTVAMLALAATVPTGLAQDTPPDTLRLDGSGAFLSDTASESNARTAMLMSRVNSLVSRLIAISGALEIASAEDSLVLRLQQYELQIQALEDLHELAETLVALEGQEPHARLRTLVQGAYSRVTPRVWLSIENLQAEIDEVRANRPSTEAARIMDLENTVATLTERLDGIYGHALRHVERLAELGVDSTEARQELSFLLSKRADELSGRVSLALVRINELKSRGDAQANEDVALRLEAARRNLRTNSSGFDATLDAMERLGMQTTDHRAKLISATRDLSATLTNTGVALNLVRQGAGGVAKWFQENTASVVAKLVLFLAVLLGFNLLARLLRWLVALGFDRYEISISTLLRRMLLGSVHNVVMVMGLLVALSQLGVSLAPLLTGVGVVGFILGFALQDSLSNFASGVMILVYRPYDVGDIVDAGGAFGRVDAMSLVSTTILTYDNQTIVVPNNKIWGDVIKNLTHQELRRVDMTFGISYSDDISKAEQVLARICADEPLILDDPKPLIHLNKLGDSSVDFIVRPWVKVDDYWNVYWHVTREVKMRFDAEGISIPFPQRDVHVHQEGSASRETASE